MKPTLLNYILDIKLSGCHFCADKAYDANEARSLLKSMKMKPHIKSRGEEDEEKSKGKSAKRWVVERTMSWINQYRRLKIRWEKKSKNYEALCHFAFAVMAFKESGVLG